MGDGWANLSEITLTKETEHQMESSANKWEKEGRRFEK